MSLEFSIGYFRFRKRRGVPAAVRMAKTTAAAYEWYEARNEQHQEVKRPKIEMIAYVGLRRFSTGRWEVVWERGQRSGSFYEGGSLETALKEAMPRAFGQTIWRTGPVFV